MTKTQPSRSAPQQAASQVAQRRHRTVVDPGRRAPGQAGRRGRGQARLRHELPVAAGPGHRWPPTITSGWSRSTAPALEISKRPAWPACALADEIGRQSITIEANANDEGHLYGSVGAVGIVNALKRNKITITHDQVRLKGPLKELGLYTVKVHLGQDIEAELKVWVVPSVSRKARAKTSRRRSVGVAVCHWLCRCVPATTVGGSRFANCLVRMICGRCPTTDRCASPSTGIASGTLHKQWHAIPGTAPQMSTWKTPHGRFSAAVFSHSFRVAPIRISRRCASAAVLSRISRLLPHERYNAIYPCRRARSCKPITPGGEMRVV